MPDPVLIFKAVAAAGGLAAVILLACAWPWKAPLQKLAAVGCTTGAAVGFVVGCLVLGSKLQWPPREDVDRWLLCLVPAVVVAEFAAAFVERPRWIAWLARGLVAVAAGRILLHDTTYIADFPGAARQWSAFQTVVYLGAMAVALAAVWALLLRLAHRTSGRTVPLSIAVASGAAALTIMLSGYASGGQLGLALSGAIAGATVASLLLPKSIHLDGAVGVGIVGLFALLVVGRFFGELTTARAAILFISPLACWLTELPYLRTRKIWQRGVLQLVAVCLPLAFVIAQAQRQFAADSQRSNAAGQSSGDEYLNYGK
jgi:hypothetical protein